MQQQGMANILILTDLEKSECITLTQMAINTFVQHSNFSLYVEDHLKFQNVLLLTAADQGKIQYVISIGSNSTMMRAHRFFDDRSVPVVSVSDGEEPILSSFSSCEMESIIKKFINGVKERDLSLMETLQFQVSERLKDPKTEPLFKSFHFSFQLEVHRDMSKSVLKLRIYARIEGKSFYHLANVWGDGIIISTPLGSLGRNLSLSGPIVYKSSDSITIVPICPLSLNFRPIILPASAELIISIQEDSRSSGLIFADNQIVSTGLAPGKHIYLRKSSTMTKIVKGLGEKTTQEQWISCLRDVLSWGEAYNSEPKSTSASTPVTKL